MNTTSYASAMTAQFEATLAMLLDCIEKCSEQAWDAPVAKYPVWVVVYHTLCFVDCYALTEATWQPDPRFHPKGHDELEAEYPSRRFERAEMVEYLHKCRGLIVESLASETDETLAGPSGFRWLKFERAQVHIYNLRHVQHHVGAISAALRRGDLGVELRWVKAGWPE